MAWRHSGTIDPVSLKILAGLPLSTNKAVTYLKPDNENFKEYLGRVDHSFTQNDRLSVRYSYNQFERGAVFDPSNFLAYADGSNITNQNYLIHENHIFRPTLLNDFRFSYARENSTRGPATTYPAFGTWARISLFSRPQTRFNKSASTDFSTSATTPMPASSATTSPGATTSAG